MFPSKYLLNCTHEAEWNPFQIHYSENLVATLTSTAPPVPCIPEGSYPVYKTLGQINEVHALILFLHNPFQFRCLS
jgi:hypothetical protein